MVEATQELEMELKTSQANEGDRHLGISMPPPTLPRTLPTQPGVQLTATSEVQLPSEPGGG